MAKLTKKQKALVGKVDSNKLYPLDNALTIVKENATAKFDESIDVAVQLGIDAKKSDQVVRGAVVLPNGTGKTKRVAVPRAPRPRKPRPPVPTSSAWTTWPPRSRPARWTSTS
jgi:ribosomal protein L1